MRLIPDIAVWWEPCNDANAKTDWYSDLDHFVIKLDPSLMGLGRFTKLTLLHEIAHVKLWPIGSKIKDNGHLFDKEIQRLATFRSYRKLL